VTVGVREMKAREMTSARGDSLLQELRAGKPLADIASAQRLELKTTGLIGRDAADPAARIITEAFLLPSVTDKVRATAGFALESGDYVLLSLEEIKDGDISSLSQADQLKARRELGQIMGTSEVSAFIDELKKRATIIIPEQRIEDASAGQINHELH
jgi:peptidyl-prolyl cis-trans isomerase D